jgi:hypothetical protein
MHSSKESIMPKKTAKKNKPIPKSVRGMKRTVAELNAHAKKIAKPKRKRYPPTPGVDRRRRANNPRTGSRYVSEEAKLKILDTIGPQSLDAKTIAERSGLSLTLVSCVVKHHEGIFLDKEATNAPREVDAFGKQTTGPRAAKYKLGKLALRYYDARTARDTVAIAAANNHLESRPPPTHMVDTSMGGLLADEAVLQ